MDRRRLRQSAPDARTLAAEGALVRFIMDASDLELVAIRQWLAFVATAIRTERLAARGDTVARLLARL